MRKCISLSEAPLSPASNFHSECKPKNLNPSKPNSTDSLHSLYEKLTSTTLNETDEHFSLTNSLSLKNDYCTSLFVVNKTDIALTKIYS